MFEKLKNMLVEELSLNPDDITMTAELANDLGIKVFGKLPLNPAYAEAADKGEFYDIDNPYLDVAKEVLEKI